MVDEKWIKLESALTEAEAAMVETRQKLLDSKVDPTFVVLAAFHQVVVKTSIHLLDMEEQLKVCEMLQNFIDDTKASIAECRN